MNRVHIKNFKVKKTAYMMLAGALFLSGCGTTDVETNPDRDKLYSFANQVCELIYGMEDRARDAVEEDIVALEGAEVGEANERLREIETKIEEEILRTGERIRELPSPETEQNYTGESYTNLAEQAGRMTELLLVALGADLELDPEPSENERRLLREADTLADLFEDPDVREAFGFASTCREPVWEEAEHAGLNAARMLIEIGEENSVRYGGYRTSFDTVERIIVENRNLLGTQGAFIPTKRGWEQENQATYHYIHSDGNAEVCVNFENLSVERGNCEN